MPIIKNLPGNINKNMSPAERDLGVDLEIGSNFDLKVNNLQDFSLVAGTKNAAQALKLKISTEPLGNRFHPAIGVNLPIGEKSVNALSLQLDLVRSLSVDPRFDNIDATVQVNGNVYLVTIQVTIAGDSISIPLQFISEN